MSQIQLEKKKISKASKIFCQSLGIAIFVGIIISIFGITFGPSILESINENQETLKLSSDYMNIIYLCDDVMIMVA